MKLESFTAPFVLIEVVTGGDISTTFETLPDYFLLLQLFLKKKISAARELFEEVGELDALFVCLGGGGLLAGSALSARALAPACRIYGVEPEAGNDGQQSFRSGSIVHIETPKTIADGAQTQHLGAYTFGIIRRDVTDILTVSDAQLVDCMRFFAERMKLVVEPTGCLGLAAARAMGSELKGQRVGVIISGGNVDLDRFSTLLRA